MALEKKNFKIGIVTFFYANNYGGVLQAYALQKFLQENGYASEFVNYLPDEDLNLKQKIKEVLKSLFGKKTKLNPFNEIFKKFVTENLVVGNKIFTKKELTQTKYDLLIASSDQIWNTKLNKENTAYFLLDFGNIKTKKISYASCIGQPEQLKQYESFFENELKHFEKVSVRNDFSKEFVDKYQIDSFVACDPTLLINFDGFDREYKLPFKEYILVYSLNMSLETLLNDTLKKIFENLDLPIIVLNSKYKAKVSLERLSINDATPEQWVWLFKNASFVLTDSFHGVIFSMKYEKNFLAIHGNDWRSYRLLDTVKRYGCEDRCISDGYESEWMSIDIIVDYTKINELVAEHINYSSAYLIQIINK